MLSDKKVYLVTTDNLHALQECPTGIDSIWFNEKKAEARRDELIKEWNDDIWYVDDRRVSK